ncbi:methyltransferase domain-containing protein [Salinisphaera sp. Q1T1-3]|nr:methyltransferase domain-containing protein [Salinisphaera sp. Q1T1-3]
MLDLEYSSHLLRLLAEPTRLRLLLLLGHESLTVAELTSVTQLTQSRISTHLARLREAGLVLDEGVAGSNRYRVDAKRWPHDLLPLWNLLSERVDDAQIAQDRERAAEIVRRRSLRGSWAESVAGRMERQYSPGRTWEAVSRSIIECVEFGNVLDIGSGDGLLAELLCARCQRFTCLDLSPAVIEAARQRLAPYPNVDFKVGDMHALPFAEAAFDQVFMLHGLSYSADPAQALAEAGRVLRPGGRVVVATIARHEHAATVAAYDHVNLGFTPDEIADWLAGAGLVIRDCDERARERHPPYFRLITASADKR